MVPLIIIFASIAFQSSHCTNVPIASSATLVENGDGDSFSIDKGFTATLTAMENTEVTMTAYPPAKVDDAYEPGELKLFIENLATKWVTSYSYSTADGEPEVYRGLSCNLSYREGCPIGPDFDDKSSGVPATWAPYKDDGGQYHQQCLNTCSGKNYCFGCGFGGAFGFNYLNAYQRFNFSLIGEHPMDSADIFSTTSPQTSADFCIMGLGDQEAICHRNVILSAQELYFNHNGTKARLDIASTRIANDKIDELHYVILKHDSTGHHAYTSSTGGLGIATWQNPSANGAFGDRQFKDYPTSLANGRYADYWSDPGSFDCDIVRTDMNIASSCSNSAVRDLQTSYSNGIGVFMNLEQYFSSLNDSETHIYSGVDYVKRSGGHYFYPTLNLTVTGSINTDSITFSLSLENFKLVPTKFKSSIQSIKITGASGNADDFVGSAFVTVAISTTAAETVKLSVEGSFILSNKNIAFTLKRGSNNVKIPIQVQTTGATALKVCIVETNMCSASYTHQFDPSSHHQKANPNHGSNGLHGVGSLLDSPEGIVTLVVIILIVVLVILLISYFGFRTVAHYKTFQNDIENGDMSKKEAVVKSAARVFRYKKISP